VVVVDPGFNGCLGFLESLETMVPDALELEGPHDVGVALWQRSESTQERVLQRPSRFLGIVALADVATDAFAIGAVQHHADVDQAVPLGPHIGRIGRPAHVGAPVTPRPSDTPGTARSRSAT